MPPPCTLNDSQKRAVTHVTGPLLVLAGPGSGKTRVVTHRVAHLVACGVPANQIVALSFTNKAADEMRRRVDDLVGRQPVEMGTFHRFAARLLRRHARLVGLTADYSILDTDDATAMLRRAIRKSGLTTSHTPVDRIAGVISRAKNELQSPESFEPRWGRPVEEVARRIWPVYQDMLLRANSVDFDDLLVHVARLLAEAPDLRAMLDARHRFILVDEYQDTNAAQYSILRGLSIDHPNLAVTGDPDQAIYGWRGASIRNILEFERDYPNAVVVALEHNYRSTANILGVADRLIAHNSRRKPKRLITDAAPGLQVRITLDSSGHEEAERIATEIAEAIDGERRSARDFAILFRTNALSRSVEVALRSRGIAYHLVRGLEFFNRREIRDVLAWLRMLRNPRDDEAMLRVVNVPPRGVGRQSLDRLAAWADDRRASRLEAAGQALAIHGLSKRAATGLLAFYRLYTELATAATTEPGVSGLLEAVLEKTGYRRMLVEEGEDDDDGQDRLANVEELLTAARQFDDSHDVDVGPTPDSDPLGDFLEMTALAGDTDTWDRSDDRVALLTYHAAKGLEFPVVYLLAMEDGILPHERSLDSPEQLEEERRLVFVGITRGREEVHVSAARIRDYRGTRRLSIPSLFLTELHGSETLVTGAEAPADLACNLFTRDAHAQVDDAHCDPTTSRITRPDGLVMESDEGPRRPDQRRRRRDEMSVRTAAEIVAGVAPPTRPLWNHRTGQRVRHPEYGDGVIMSISGVGPRAVGTVVFEGPAGTRKFILGQNTLESVE